MIIVVAGLLAGLVIALLLLLPLPLPLLVLPLLLLLELVVTLIAGVGGQDGRWSRGAEGEDPARLSWSEPWVMR